MAANGREEETDMPVQYSAADTSSVPRGTQFTGYGIAGGNHTSALKVTTGDLEATPKIAYPNTIGSYNNGEYEPTDGMYLPGSGSIGPSGIDLVQMEGVAVRHIVWPGFFNQKGLAPSGEGYANIEVHRYINPSPVNADPYLDSDV